MNQRRIYARVETIPSRHAKEIRAQSIAGRMAVRGLFLPALPPQAPWLSDFVNEVLAFPTSTDDQVDCLSIFGQLLDRLVPGSEPAKPKPLKLLSTDPALCNISLTELFEANERRHQKSGRI